MSAGKIILTVVIIIIIIVVILAALLWLKMMKDVKDMKKGITNLLKAFGNPNAEKIADCYIDASVKKLGYMRTKEIYMSKVMPTADEAAKMIQISKDCGLGDFSVVNAMRGY
jgi:hypothetical protein